MGSSTASSAEARWLGLADGIRGGQAGRTGFRVVATAIAVCLAYYAGSRVGLLMRFPPATTSLLWPPNAILSSVLLLTRSPRRWWLYLAAAFPAHV
jgi:hypothetical protein